MKDTARETFRWAAHTSGLAVAKPKDYEGSGDVEAANAYDAWTHLRAGDSPLNTGDILEDESGILLIAKYVGFERAQWWMPEPKPASPLAGTEANDLAVTSSAPAH